MQFIKSSHLNAIFYLNSISQVMFVTRMWSVLCEMETNVPHIHTFFRLRSFFGGVLFKNFCTGPRHRLRNCQKRNGATKHYIMKLVATVCSFVFGQIAKRPG